MASIRFPGKILAPILGFPMIEHVRRRANISKKISEVYVATCDQLISDTIKKYDGKVIMTSNSHTNGTSRVAEAAKQINASHIVLIQGDEPLLLPRFIDKMVESISKYKQVDAWNGTGPIENENELDRHSFVKCSVNNKGQILYCFRRTPSYAKFSEQKKYIRKILGIIAFKKNYLETLVNLPQTSIEKHESIEQMRIIENGGILSAVDYSHSLPSVNEPHELDLVTKYISENREQLELVRTTFNI